MPIRVSYPGVYVEEISGGQPVASGVSTASTAFADFFSKGPMNKAVRIASMADFNRVFGGLHLQSESSYGLKQYFLNGGQEAWVVRAGDGTAASALLDVRVETPGLGNRFKWALESANNAKNAAKAAKDAAKAAERTFGNIKPDSAAQQLEQLSQKLRGETTEAADETRKTTAATRDAAKQAKASSDELAIAIAALAAAAGPVASRTMKAAQHTADAAAASSEAATQNKDVIGAAQQAVKLAEAALGQGKTARSVLGTSQDLLAVLKAIEATQAAVDATKTHNAAAQKAGDLTAASQAAMEAASSAAEAAEQAGVAVRGAQAVLGTLESSLDAKKDPATVAQIQAKLTALVALDMKTPARKAAQASLTAQTAVETADAKAAAKAALAALKTIDPTAMEQAGGVSGPENGSIEVGDADTAPAVNIGSQKTCRQAASLAQSVLQKMAKQVAKDAAGVAGRAGIEGGMEDSAVSEAKDKLEAANRQLTLADAAVGKVEQQKKAVEPDDKIVHAAAQKATGLAVQAATKTQTAVLDLGRLLGSINKVNLAEADKAKLEPQQKAVGADLTPKPADVVREAKEAQGKVKEQPGNDDKTAAGDAETAADKVTTIIAACTGAIDTVLGFTFAADFDDSSLKDELSKSKKKLEALKLAAESVKTEKEKANPDAEAVKDAAQTAISEAKEAAAAAKGSADGIKDALNAIPGDRVVQDTHKQALEAAKNAISQLSPTLDSVKTEADNLSGEDMGAVNSAATTAGKVKGITAACQEAVNAAEAVLQTVFTGKVVDAANLAIIQATAATQDALVAAKLASTDAKVAASTVGSAAVTLAARAAVSGTEKAGNRTAAALKQSKAVIAQLNKALVTALQSVKPANEAADKISAASEEIGTGSNGDVTNTPEDPVKEIQKVVDAAQAALTAANNALAAAEAVEKATVEVSNLTYEATVSADLAARSAKVAVDANEEAGRPPTLRIAAANEGIWGDNIQIDIEVQGAEFSMLVSEFVAERGVTRRVAQESYSRLNLEKGDTRFAVELLNEQSKLVQLDYIGPMVSGAYPDEVNGQFLRGGHDGGLADATQLTGADGALMALEDIQPFIFNLLCLPSVGSMPGGQASVAIANAQAYCAKKRAFFIVDIPAEVDSTDKMLDWVDEYGNAQAYHMAVYFPRLVIPDPLQDFRARNVGPSGTLAGVYARTDNQRGVWKAPAGINAVLQGAEVVRKITDDQNGLLNPRGVNVLRSFPVYGNISWGARTLAGADAISSEWKYLNVRRLFNYVEESLFQSLKWAVFEPNDEELWSKIRMQVATFLAGLFSQGAFQGSGEGSSYFVVCDGTITTPVDIDLGVVNVDIGIAPSKPAEFVVLRFQQIAGQAA